MNDRMYLSIVILVCVIVIVGVIALVTSIVEGPRHAHRPEGEAISSDQFSQLSAQISHLSEQIGGTPGVARTHGPDDLPPGEILVRWTDRDLPIDDPDASAWEDAPITTVALQAQSQTMPLLDTLTVSAINVQALTDGQRVAWRVTWGDATADYHLDADRFCDAVALQFPLKANAAFTMGAVDFPVHILQWKAIWQKDIDEQFQDVQDLHPNYWTDLYWFAEGEFPYRVPEAFQRTEALDWFVAYRAGNPMADLYRRVPVQEMIAEGFGTLTAQPHSDSVGRGIWRDGEWAVVFSRPLRTNDDADFQFTPGTRDVVAFAVWEGDAGNVGGRKHHSEWTVFEVQQ